MIIHKISPSISLKSLDIYTCQPGANQWKFNKMYPMFYPNEIKYLQNFGYQYKFQSNVSSLPVFVSMEEGDIGLFITPVPNVLY